MIDAMRDDDLFDDAKRLQERLLELGHETERAQSDFQHSVRRLHAAGASLREIAERLGLSHQRVHQIVEDDTAERPRQLRLMRRTKPETPFTRLSAGARNVVDRAQAEADALAHDYLGTEHLLLALAVAEETPAARALRDCGVTAERVRDGIRLLVGRGRRLSPGSPRRLTPRTKRVLELARREAGDAEIDERHLLLGLLLEGEGVAAKMLDEFGCGNLTGVRRSLAG